MPRRREGEEGEGKGGEGRNEEEGYGERRKGRVVEIEGAGGGT